MHLIRERCYFVRSVRASPLHQSLMPACIHIPVFLYATQLPHRTRSIASAKDSERMACCVHRSFISYTICT